MKGTSLIVNVLLDKFLKLLEDVEGELTTQEKLIRLELAKMGGNTVRVVSAHEGNFMRSIASFLSKSLLRVHSSVTGMGESDWKHKLWKPPPLSFPWCTLYFFFIYSRTSFLRLLKRITFPSLTCVTLTSSKLKYWFT